MRSRFPALIILALLAPAAHSGGQGTVTLRLKFKPGQKLTYVMSTSTSASGGPAAANMSSKMSSTMSYTVKGQTKKGWKVVSKVEAMSMEGPKSPQGGNVQGDLAKRMVGVTSSFTFDQYGRAVDASGGSSTMIQGMGQAMQGTGFMGVVYPRSAVGVGWTWEDTFDMAPLMNKLMPMFKSLKMTFTGTKIPIHYKLRSFGTRGSKRVAFIEITMKGNIGMQSQASGQVPAMTMQIGMDMTTNSVIDVATGIPLEIQEKGLTTTSMAGMNMKQTTSVSTKLK